MYLVFGERAYGRVDEWRGEFAHTRFGHLWFLPFVPVKSVWVTTALGPHTAGFEIRTHRRSVVATYLRWFGPVVAVGAAFRAPLPIGLPVAAALAALVAWSWTWRTLRGAAARRRSDFHLLAFGSRCEPARFIPAALAEHERILRERWAAIGEDRTPEDVARFGASDARQAVVAYGLLQLAAITGRDRAAAALADRIVTGQIEEAAASGGPYRSTVATPAALEAGVAELVRVGRLDFADVAKRDEAVADDGDDEDGEWDTACGDGACTGVLGEDERCTECGLTYAEGEAASAAAFAKLAEVERGQQRKRAAHSATQLILAGAAVTCGGALLLAFGIGIMFFAGPGRTVPVSQLGTWADGNDDVSVVCDRVSDAGKIERTTRHAGRSTSTVYAVVVCEQGAQAVPILDELDAPEDALIRHGRVHPESPVDREWYGLLPPSPPAVPYYIAPEGKPLALPVACAVALLPLAGIGMCVVGVRRRRRALRG